MTDTKQSECGLTRAVGSQDYERVSVTDLNGGIASILAEMGGTLECYPWFSRHHRNDGFRAVRGLDLDPRTGRSIQEWILSTPYRDRNTLSARVLVCHYVGASPNYMHGRTVWRELRAASGSRTAKALDRFIELALNDAPPVPFVSREAKASWFEKVKALPAEHLEALVVGPFDALRMIIDHPHLLPQE